MPLHSDYGRTPLHVAAVEGSSENVRLLLAHGARQDQEDHDGMTPLMLASYYGHMSAARVLLEAPDSDVDRPGQSSMTALHAAASTGHAAVVELLLLAGAVVDRTNDEGLTALALCTFVGNVDGLRDSMRVLITAGADVDRADTILGDTPLHGACRNVDPGLTEILSRGGAKVDVVNHRGETPLFLASLDGNLATVEALLRAGADADRTVVVDGTTIKALHAAAHSGNLEVVKVLLEAGADATFEDGHGMTPAARAIREGHEEVARFLEQFS